MVRADRPAYRAAAREPVSAAPLRARAIEGERSRISREIHDGILQTLLSVDIQLDVLRRKLGRNRSRRPGTGHSAANRAARDRGAAPHGHRYASASASRAPIWWT